MSDEDFPLGEPIELPVAKLFFGGLAQGPTFNPVVDPANARFLNAQAHLLELDAEDRLAAREISRVRPVWDVLPGRFDLVVVGPRGSGKSRAVAKLRRLIERCRVLCVSTVACWPDWNAVRDCVVFVDEAGVLFESDERTKRGELPPGLANALSLARHRNVSLVLVAQTTHQVPPAVLRQGVGLLVAAAPWMWRVQAREELRDRLDAAHAAMGRAPPGSYALVDTDGVAYAVSLDEPPLPGAAVLGRPPG